MSTNALQHGIIIQNQQLVDLIKISKKGKPRHTTTFSIVFHKCTAEGDRIIIPDPTVVARVWMY